MTGSKLIRVPSAAPADGSAEENVLGAILLSARLLEPFAEEIRLRPDHFYYRETHGEIYAAMLGLEARGEGVDSETIRFELEARGTLERVGGRAKIELLAGSVPAVGNARSYAQRVVDLAHWRARLASALAQLEAVSSMDERAFEDAARLVESVVDVGHDGLMSPEELASEWVDWYQADASTAIPTPWARITKGLHGGFRPGDTTVICGRPGKGKSTVGDQLLEYAKSERGLTGCAYINEMSRVDRVSRLLAGRAGASFERIMERSLTPEEIKRVLREAPRLPFHMQPCSGWSADAIARHLRHHRWGVAFVDLATRIPASTTAEWDHVSGVLNDAARQSGTHLFLAVQLNRERDTGAVRSMPVLRDLRNTGAWEADARNVLIVHRREEINSETDVPVTHDDGVLHLAKVSNGRPDAERVYLNFRRMRFEVLPGTSSEEASEDLWAA